HRRLLESSEFKSRPILVSRVCDKKQGPDFRQGLMLSVCAPPIELSATINQHMILALFSHSFLQRLLTVGGLNLASGVAARSPELSQKIKIVVLVEDQSSFFNGFVCANRSSKDQSVADIVLAPDHPHHI